MNLPYPSGARRFRGSRALGNPANAGGLAEVRGAAYSAPVSSDVLIIGAGHNGLVCAYYLAARGLKVTVLEARSVVGGAAVTEEFAPGFRNSTASYTVGLLNPKVIRDMRLYEHGLKVVLRRIDNFLPTMGDDYLLAGRDGLTKREIARHSAADAENYDAYSAALNQVVGIVRQWLLRAPPNAGGGIGELLALLKLGRGVGRLEHHAEGRAPSRLALHGQIVAQQVAEAAGDRQPQAGPLVPPGGAAVGLLERFEHVPQPVGRDADPGVLHVDPQRPAIRRRSSSPTTGRDSICASWPRCMLHGVASLHVEETPISGLSRSSFVRPMALYIARCGALAGPSIAFLL